MEVPLEGVELRGALAPWNFGDSEKKYIYNSPPWIQNLFPFVTCDFPTPLKLKVDK